jgi:hypothetical protein
MCVCAIGLSSRSLAAKLHLTRDRDNSDLIVAGGWVLGFRSSSVPGTSDSPRSPGKETEMYIGGGVITLIIIILLLIWLL